MKTLWVTGGNFGGTGKTTGLALVADWLKTQELKPAYIDADPGNLNTARSFENWLQTERTKEGKLAVRRINIQNPDDIDLIFTLSKTAPTDHILCDLPANAGNNMMRWWREIATKEVWKQANVQLVTLITITQDPQAWQNAAHWLKVVGPQGTYLVAFNRIGYEPFPRPVEEAFKGWFEFPVTPDYSVKTVEIDHLHRTPMEALVAAQTLPYKFTGEGLDTIYVKRWANRVGKQLDDLKLF